ncbi:MAG: hypothetical protein IJS65_07340 [Clostridia bacterium]|nr:hypothetical protein [Clostridia bacterium]
MAKIIKKAAICAAIAVLFTLSACAGKNAETPVFGGAVYEETPGDAAAPSDRSMPQDDAPPAEEITPTEETPPAAEEAPALKALEEEPAPPEKEDAPLAAPEETPAGEEKTDYVLNINSKRFHYPSCSGVASMKEKNRQDFNGTRQEVLDMGYSPCGICKP